MKINFLVNYENFKINLNFNLKINMIRESQKKKRIERQEMYIEQKVRGFFLTRNIKFYSIRRLRSHVTIFDSYKTL